MDIKNLKTNAPDELESEGAVLQHQFLPDLSLIHEKFVDLWFKQINYFNANSGQLPTENLQFIDGLNFVECCFLQNEMNTIAGVVADYMEHAGNQTKDFYTVEYDMSTQVSAYMNYIDQRLASLHQVQGLMNQNHRLPDLSIFFGEEGID